jgi:hypothetical protein
MAFDFRFHPSTISPGMTPVELTIAVLAYVAALLLGQRGIAMAIPEAQEAAFAIATILAVGAAAALYFRRENTRAPASALLSLGGLLAIAAIAAGMFSQLMWSSTAAPAITLPIAAVGAALAPFAIFPIVRRAFEGEGEGAAPLNANHVIMAAAVALLACAIAFAIPAPIRSNVKLVPQQLPGLRVSLPDWNALERNMLGDYGTIKLDDPAGYGRYMALHWTSGDPVQADEHVRAITGGQMLVVERNATVVSGHEAVTYYLESGDRARRAYTTIWNCPQDHRVCWLFSYLNGSKSAIYATHQRVLDTVRCHTGDKPTAVAVFPRYIAPAGFTKNPDSPALMYLGPERQTIVLDAGIGGKSSLLAGDVPDDAVASLITQLAGLEKLEGKPSINTMHDLLGHERRVWSAVGNTSGGTLVQVEVMVWYCDVRDMTFVGGYATQGAHPVQEGIDVLLPAACHEWK